MHIIEVAKSLIDKIHAMSSCQVHIYDLNKSMRASLYCVTGAIEIGAEITINDTCITIIEKCSTVASKTQKYDMCDSQWIDAVVKVVVGVMSDRFVVIYAF